MPERPVRDRYLVACADGEVWTLAGKQRSDGFMVVGSSGNSVRQELAKRARPRIGMSSRDFMR